ncbi:unnamed protein product [Calicophoron daubneyi]|uniref:U2A'/phosphoprotein 32 family A C-terminal domain-containing protein n=1 Tax=Calicophoron daubneyi TaxID=300641 RepID=A0AAV2TKQ3_CALDB
MVRITEELVRKRAEHNEGEIFSLEELSLHQQNLERIENLDKWCRELKILYLQNNLIPRIENVSRLKKLEYLNLALNNVEKVENLEGCESLKKLDLTVNFVGYLTSIESLIGLYSLEELFLTGNPCTEYPNYREYVVATLPQLRTLDGTEITKSERIVALQKLEQIRPGIEEAQQKFALKRVKEKREAEVRKREHETKLAACEGDIDSVVSEFWKETVPFTPESRIETHEYTELQEKARHKNEDKKDPIPKRPKIRFFSNDGRPYNINEPKINFSLQEKEVNGDECYVLDVAIYRHMDTSLVDCDVQPNYVRITIRGKVLQLAMPEEVKADLSVARRSQTSGHLVITMPKASQHIRATATCEETVKNDKVAFTKRSGDSLPLTNRNHGESTTNKQLSTPSQPSSALLELEGPRPQQPNWKTIVHDSANEKEPKKRTRSNVCQKVTESNAEPFERPNSPDFVDCPDVPPLI